VSRSVVPTDGSTGLLVINVGFLIDRLDAVINFEGHLAYNAFAARYSRLKAPAFKIIPKSFIHTLIRFLGS
jgi:hypothetical protein